MFAIVPLAVVARVRDEHALGHETIHAPDLFADSYQVPDANFGWSACDACYSCGSLVFDDDEALVIAHRPPQCRVWNLLVGKQFMATYGAAEGSDARCSIHGHNAVPNSGGSVTVVSSRGMTAHPNSLKTLSYPRGNLAFRWFLADDVPTRPSTTLFNVSDAPTAVS
jgi:hypothetical protein